MVDSGPVTNEEIHAYFRGELPQMRQILSRQSIDIRNLKTDQAMQGQQIVNVREFLFGDKETESPGLNKRLTEMQAQLGTLVKQRDTLQAQLILLKWLIPVLGGTSILDIALRLFGAHT